ncbi:hypothetical protein ACFYU9_07100 [Streptomyces sp. NPDC004327]|uniref:hypothetical protein n=1 Tax=unclassified Streptomyces TaxID=2593676 RepID=UPI0036BA0908
MGQRSRKWLRRLWRDTQLGLTALGQGFGLFTVPECYGYLPVYGGGAPDPCVTPGPQPRHPERLAEPGGPAMTAQEAALWAQLADVWADADPAFGALPPRLPGPRPRPE